MYFGQQEKVEEVKTASFVDAIHSGDVVSVVVKGQDVTGKRRDGTSIRAKQDPEGKLAMGLMEKYPKVDFDFQKESPFSGAMAATLLVPILLAGVIIWVFMRQISAGNNKALAFGKSRARLHGPADEKVTFEDVAGVEEAKEELMEIVDFLKDPKRFERLGGRIPKGVLLVGSPGTGKTLLARSVAGEAGVPFFSLSGSDFVEMFVGVGAARVRDLFGQGRSHRPSIIFIDEIDAVGRHRGSGLGGGHDEREQTLNQLLTEMDGFSTEGGVVLLAATNRPDVLDPALLRGGRFDRRVHVDLPDLNGREAILKVHARRIQLEDQSFLTKIARGTPGSSGADLENIINEAALLAARRNKEKVGLDDLEEARDKVCWGRERRSMMLEEEDKRITAYHEAGHAVVGRAVPLNEPIHKVTIIPRSMGMLGSTILLPEKDRHHTFREQILATICMLYGGRAAEEAAFGDITGGACNDIERATELARRMVCEWGMSRVLGPIAFGAKEETLFLGREVTRHQAYSEQTAMAIDEEVKEILADCYQKAKIIIAEKRAALDRIVAKLMEQEVLDGSELETLM